MTHRSPGEFTIRLILFEHLSAPYKEVNEEIRWLPLFPSYKGFPQCVHLSVILEDCDINSIQYLDQYLEQIGETFWGRMILWQ